MSKKTLEKVYGFKLDKWSGHYPNRIIVVGCGGNGSHLVPDIARLIKSLNSSIELILIDGDTVEEKNLIRQHFSASDVGKNKAQVLSSRYGAAFGIATSYIPEYLTKDNIGSVSSSAVLWITCTDNLVSRKLVADEGGLWIDLGNLEYGGQVTFTSRVPDYWGHSVFKDGCQFETPNVFDLFPEFKDRLKEEVPIEERSCAEIAEEAPHQAGFVNVICAAIAKNYVHALLTHRPIKSYQTLFSIDNVFETRLMTQSALKNWIETIPRFKNYDFAAKQT